MNLKEFNQYFCIELSKTIKDTGVADPVEVPKNNRLLHGASVHFYGQEIGCVIYTDEFFELWQRGFPIEGIIENVKKDVLAQKMISFDVSSINRENAQNHLRAAVVNYEDNKEWLRNIPHERIQDLAVYAKWSVEPDATIKVNNEMLGLMKMTKEEALTTAKANTLKSMELKSMEEALVEMMRKNGVDEGMEEDLRTAISGDPLYVLSVQSGLDGAALIADTRALKKVYEELGESFYILPSSIHEALLIAKSDWDRGVEELRQMVQSVNENEVAIEDQLSNNVYEFDGHSLKLAEERELEHDTTMADTFTHRRSR